MKTQCTCCNSDKTLLSLCVKIKKNYFVQVRKRGLNFAVRKKIDSAREHEDLNTSTPTGESKNGQEKVVRWENFKLKLLSHLIRKDESRMTGCAVIRMEEIPFLN
jgi:hypothetical protein